MSLVNQRSQLALRGRAPCGAFKGALGENSSHPTLFAGHLAPLAAMISPSAVAEASPGIIARQVGFISFPQTFGEFSIPALHRMTAVLKDAVRILASGAGLVGILIAMTIYGIGCAQVSPTSWLPFMRRTFMRWP